MAESLVTSMSSRYFCHKCNQEINPVLPEFKCPGCREGFIEEVSNDAALETSSDESSEPLDMYDRFSDDGARVGDILRVLQLFTGEQQGGQGNRSNRGRGDANRGGIWEMAIPYFQILHGNPGDYAWGSQGLDAIITQLLNSIESSGPPPMPKEEIDKLPTIKICQEDVDKNLQCTVCMEDYKLDEPVRVLSCNHVYHNDCIVPWLEMHGTCPICRKILIENQQSQRNCENRNNPNNQQQSNQRTSNSNVNNTSGYRDLLDYD